MDRREFTKVMGVVAAGMLAGSKAFAEDDKKVEAKAAAKVEKHVCKGHNDCKGQGMGGKNACKGKGGCASASAKHDCKGKNDCKGMGGCAPGDNACAGKNSCKGKGGCSVPVKAEHIKDKAGKSSCKGKSGCKGR